MPDQLMEKIPEFQKDSGVKPGEEGFIDWTALTSVPTANNAREAGIIILVAVIIIGGAELLIRLFQVPSYIFPAPSAIFGSLVHSFGLLWPHVLVTLEELALGYIIGALIG